MSEFSDEEWFYNDTLRRLDSEVDPDPPGYELNEDGTVGWAISLEVEFLEGWRALEAGPPLWFLEHEGVSVQKAEHYAAKSRERFASLTELGAPRIIILHEAEILWRWRATRAWQHVLEARREMKEMSGE